MVGDPDGDWVEYEDYAKLLEMYQHITAAVRKGGEHAIRTYDENGFETAIVFSTPEPCPHCGRAEDDADFGD